MKNFIPTILVAVACACAATFTFAQNRATVTRPDGSTQVKVHDVDGKVYYQVDHKGKPFVGSSRLGLRTNAFDFSELEFVSVETGHAAGKYTMDRSKASEMSYDVTTAVLTYRNAKDKKIRIEFRVGNNDVAFRYFIPKEGETGSVRILEELTEFTFNDPLHMTM